MFDYASGFAASGSIGGYNFNIGNANPYGYQTPYYNGYPVTGQIGGQIGFGQQDNTLLFVLLAVVVVVLISK